MSKKLLTLILVLYCYTSNWAQQVGPLPGLNIQEAPLIDCYLPGYASATSFQPNNQNFPNPFCGSVENNQWLAFRARYGTYVFTIEVDNCVSGEGLQAQIYGLNGSCSGNPFNFISVSNCETPGIAGLMQVTATGLNQNEVYFLMIDGWAGDVCDYEIIDVQKLDPFDPGDPSLDGPTTVNAGQTATYTVNIPSNPPSVNHCSNVADTICGGAGCFSNIDDYTLTWTGPPGSNVTPIPGTLSANITFGNFGGLVTVQMTGPCFSLFLSLEVTVQRYFSDVHCEYDGPYLYCGQIYQEAGFYSDQCMIDPYTIEFFELFIHPFDPPSVVEEICGPDDCVIVEGFPLCGEGSYTIPYWDGFCPSEMYVEVVEITAEANLPPADTLTPSSPMVELPGYNPDNSPEVVYEWTGPGITPDIANEPNPVVSLPGWYNLEVYHPQLGCYSSDLIIIYYNSDCIANTPVSPSDSCTWAPSFCNSYLDGFCSSNEGYEADTTGNLNQILGCTIENNQWLEFKPCAPQVELELFVYNCEQNQGLEFSILQSSDCQNFTSISQCFQVGNGYIYNYTFNGLSPGTSYFLMIDGIQGDICEYSINIIDGIEDSGDIFFEFSTFNEGYIDGPTSVCLNTTATYTLVPGDCSLSNFTSMGNCPIQYQTLCDSTGTGTFNWSFTTNMDTLWHLPEGAIFLSDSTSTSIEVAFTDTLGGTIWVELIDPNTGVSDSVFLDSDCTAFCGDISYTNNCTNNWSLDVEIEYEIDTLPTVVLCVGECIEFCDITICDAGFYPCLDTCRIQLLPVELELNEVIDLGQIELCQDSCHQFLGTDYCSSGSYSVIDNSGCPVTYNFEIVSFPNDTTDLGIINICAGECYDLNSQSYCNEGVYIIESNSGACPTFESFELQFSDPDTTNLGIIELCPDSCFQLLNQEFCETGFYSLVDSSNACLEWYTFAIQVLPPAIVDLGLIDICQDSCFTFNNTSFCDPGTYEVIIQGDCPTINTFEIQLIEVDTIQLGIQVLCEGECFSYQGVDYCDAGFYSVPNQDPGQCPTISAFEVQIDVTEIIPLGLFELCLGDCFVLNGESYCESGDYEVQVIDPAGCYIVYTFNLETVPPSNLVTGPAIELCDPTYTQYTVSFNINSEFPPYSVNGQEIIGNTFTSNPIPSGAPYTFEVSDANDCSGNVFVQGQYSCPLLCLTDAGEMDTTVLYPCDNTPFTATHLGNEYLVAGDTLEFILHTNNDTTIGTILDRNLDGTFSFLPGSMDYEIPYYVSAVAGPKLNGMVDLDDICSSVAAGQPVFFFEPVTLHIQVPTILTCQAPISHLEGAIDGGSGQFSMQWMFDGTSIGQGAAFDAEVSGQYQWVVVDLLTGCTALEQTTLFADQDLPEFQLYNSGFLCGEPATLSIPHPDPDWTVTWTFPDGTQAMGPSIETTVGGIHEVAVLGVNGCTKQKMASLPDPPSPITFIELEIHAPICPDEADGFIGLRSIEGGTPPFEYTLNGIDPIFNNQFTALHPGEYLLEVKDANDCTWEEVIHLETPETLELDLGADREILLGEVIQLEWQANFTPIEIYWYKNDQLLNKNNESTLEVAPHLDAEYKILCISPNGCEIEDRILIKVKDGSPIYIPNAFSPNNDDINDLFFVQAGKNVQSIKSIRIFSRWGEKVFEIYNVPPNDKSWGERHSRQ